MRASLRLCDKPASLFFSLCWPARHISGFCCAGAPRSEPSRAAVVAVDTTSRVQEPVRRPRGRVRNNPTRAGLDRLPRLPVLPWTGGARPTNTTTLPQRYLPGPRVGACPVPSLPSPPLPSPPPSSFSADCNRATVGQPTVGTKVAQQQKERHPRPFALPLAAGKW